MKSEKSGERGERIALPALDATQTQVIAALTKTREYWQTTAVPYNPLRASATVESRYAAGKALRKEVPRERHAEWKSPAQRPSGADFVIAGNAGRQQDLVPLRMGRMAVSPFAFLRGAAAAMAWDLSHTQQLGLYGTPQRHASLLRAIKQRQVKVVTG